MERADSSDLPSWHSALCHAAWKIEQQDKFLVIREKILGP
jgi:hypothetical protein